MGLLLNRVKAACNAAGTGAVTPGVAVPPYQTWTGGGASSGGFYDYLIEQGTAWEMGVGLYNGTTISRPGPGSDLWFQSSTGSLLSVSSSATIACVESSASIQANRPFYAAPLSVPQLANYTQILNATSTSGGSSIAATSRGVVLNALYGGGDSITMAQRTAPAVDFTYTVFVNITWNGYSANSAGIVVQDNTGKMVVFGPRTLSSTSWNWTYMKWNNLNSYNGESGLAGPMPMVGPMWLQLRQASGQFQFSASFDGEHFTAFNFVSATDFLGSTLSGVGCYFDNVSGNAVIKGYLHILSDSLTTP